MTFEWIAGIVLLLVALWVMLRLDQQVRASLRYTDALPETDNHPPATIIKPVYGADSQTAENFRSWASQDYKGPVQLIFSFQNPDDPALPLAENVLHQVTGEAIVNPVREGFSGKMSNLIYGLEQAQYDWIVFSDSDIRADPRVLSQLAEMHNQGIALSSCLMRHRLAGNLWGRIYAAFWNFEHMAFIAPSIIKHGREATGGTMSMTRATLDAMGGLEAFKDYVAEDVAMGRKAHELGLRVGLGPVVDSPVGKMDLRGLLNKFARAALFSASMNNVGESLQYAVLFSYLFVLLASALLGSWVLAGTGSVLALLRVAFASRFWAQSEGERHLFFEILLSDVVFLVAYIRALITRRLEWGGIQYRVIKGGKMVKVE